VRVFDGEREIIIMWPFSRKGVSGFSWKSTAEEVTHGIDATGLTAIVTGMLLSYWELIPCASLRSDLQALFYEDPKQKLISC